MPTLAHGGGRGEWGGGHTPPWEQAPPAGTQEAWGLAFTRNLRGEVKGKCPEAGRARPGVSGRMRLQSWWTRAAWRLPDSRGAGMLGVSGSFSELRRIDAFCPHAPRCHPSFWAKLLVPSLGTECHGIPGSGLPADQDSWERRPIEALAPKGPEPVAWFGRNLARGRCWAEDLRVWPQRSGSSTRCACWLGHSGGAV